MNIIDFSPQGISGQVIKIIDYSPQGISGQVMKIIDFSPQDISGQVMKMIDFSPQHNWHVENILFLRHFRWLNKSVAWWIQYTTIVAYWNLC